VWYVLHQRKGKSARATVNTGVRHGSELVCWQREWRATNQQQGKSDCGTLSSVSRKGLEGSRTLQATRV